MTQVKVVDTATGEEQLRDKTNQELSRDAEDFAKVEAERQKILNKINAKKQIFIKLGITEEEIKLLLG